MDTRPTLKLKKPKKVDAVIEKSDNISDFYFVPLSELYLPTHYDFIVKKLHDANFELHIHPLYPTIASTFSLKEDVFSRLTSVGKKSVNLLAQLKEDLPSILNQWVEKNTDNEALINELKLKYDKKTPVSVVDKKQRPSRLSHLKSLENNSLSSKLLLSQIEKAQKIERIEVSDEDMELIGKLDTIFSAKIDEFILSLDDDEKEVFSIYWSLDEYYCAKINYATLHSLSIKSLEKLIYRLNNSFNVLGDKDKSKVTRKLIDQYKQNDLHELFPSMLDKFNLKIRFIPFLEMICRCSPGKITLHQSLIVSENILYDFLAWNSFPATINSFKEYLILNFDYTPEDAFRITNQLRDSEQVVIENEAIASLPLSIEYTVANLLTKHSDGLTWEDIVFALETSDTFQPDPENDLDIDEVPSKVAELPILYYSGVGRFSHIMFLNTSVDFIENVFDSVNVFLKSIKAAECEFSAYIIFLISQKLPTKLKPYDIKHTIKIHGDSYGLFIFKKDDNDYISRSDKKITSVDLLTKVSYENTEIELENAVLNVIKNDPEPSKLKIISIGTDSDYSAVKSVINSLSKKKQVIKTSDEKGFVYIKDYFKDVNLPEICLIVFNFLESQNKLLSHSSLIREISAHVIDKPKLFYSTLLDYLVQENNWYYKQDLISLYPFEYESLSDVCDKIFDSRLSSSVNIVEINKIAAASINALKIEISKQTPAEDNLPKFSTTSIGKIDDYIADNITLFKDQFFGIQLDAFNSLFVALKGSSINDISNKYNYKPASTNLLAVTIKALFIDYLQLDKVQIEKVFRANALTLKSKLPRTYRFFSNDNAFNVFLEKCAGIKDGVIRKVIDKKINEDALNYFWATHLSPVQKPDVINYLSLTYKKEDGADRIFSALCNNGAIQLSNFKVIPIHLELETVIAHVLLSFKGGANKEKLISIINEKTLSFYPLDNSTVIPESNWYYNVDDKYFHFSFIEERKTFLADILSDLIDQLKISKRMALTAFVAEMKKKHAEDDLYQSLRAHELTYWVRKKGVDVNVKFSSSDEKFVQLIDEKPVAPELEVVRGITIEHKKDKKDETNKVVNITVAHKTILITLEQLILDILGDQTPRSVHQLVALLPDHDRIKIWDTLDSLVLEGKISLTDNHLYQKI